MNIVPRDGGHIGFSIFMKNAQGWQSATHLNIIIGVLTMNNQQRKKLLLSLPGSAIIQGLSAGLIFSKQPTEAKTK